MKIKKAFNFKNAWKFYKEDQQFANKKEAKAAFLFGCAAAFHLTTEEVGDLESEAKQFEALSYMKAQADAIFDDEDDDQGGEIVEALKRLFESIGKRVEVDKVSFDLRDEDVEEKFEASIKDRREKFQKLKAEGADFVFHIGGRKFSADEIDEGLNYARDIFKKELQEKRERIESREKQKAAGEALSQAGDLLKDRKKEAASIADDVQKETPKERGEAAEDEAVEAFTNNEDDGRRG